MDAERTKIFLTYKNIKHAAMANLATSFVFLRDCIDKENFDQTLMLFDQLAEAMSDWLKHVKKCLNQKQNGGNVPKEKIEEVIYPEYSEQRKKISSDLKEDVFHE